MTRAEKEGLLLHGSIVGERVVGNVARITLDDGQRKHDAAVEADDGATPSRRNYRFNAAACELDKASRPIRKAGTNKCKPCGSLTS